LSVLCSGTLHASHYDVTLTDDTLQIGDRVPVRGVPSTVAVTLGRQGQT